MVDSETLELPERRLSERAARLCADVNQALEASGCRSGVTTRNFVDCPKGKPPVGTIELWLEPVPRSRSGARYLRSRAASGELGFAPVGAGLLWALAHCRVLLMAFTGIGASFRAGVACLAACAWFHCSLAMQEPQP